MNAFTYLGITLSTSGTCFSKHVDERVRKTLTAFSTIPSPQKLSVGTALQLFHMKLAPIVSYGIPIVWEHLTAKNLIKLNSVKTTYLKRVLGVHRSTRNRLVLRMTESPLFTTELQTVYQLPPQKPLNSSNQSGK